MKLKLKPKIQSEPYVMKKQRTKRPRRLRSQTASFLISLSNSLAPPAKSKAETSDFSNDSTSCHYVGDDVSCDSSSVRKRKLRQLQHDDMPFRRITRSYYSQKENERKGNEVEVSESSCVESNSGAETTSKLKKRTQNSKELQTDNNAVSVVSEISKKDTVSGVETELSDILKNDTVSVDESVVEQKATRLGLEADLACAENFSYDDVVTEYSSSHETVLSELQSELFPDCSSDFEFSDYTPSIFLDSGSEFSEKLGDDSPPSRTYSLLLDYRQQFSRSTVPLYIRRSSFIEPERLQHSTLARFEDEDDEESYRRLRERERRQMFLHDYVEFYRSTTDYGDLILQQRSQMVHWIVEVSTAKEFQLETMFLGVSLLDRFLSRGFFKTKKCLQIVGIACLALAARIEENQPYNSVRQKNFHIERNVYTRFEVVAMEWLVQEVLNFQCFLPTIHNFMWFYLKAARADAEVERRARYLARLAMSDHEHLRHWPSTVAAGLVILASLESDQIEFYQQVIEVHVRTKDNDLHECLKHLKWLLQFVS